MKYKKYKQYRLPDFDYSGEGEYFITTCCKDHTHFFGEIQNCEIILSSLGKIVEMVWNDIPEKYDHVKLDAYQIMPDHFHGLVVINDRQDYIHQNVKKLEFKSGIKNNPMELKQITLGRIIRWFKGRVKFEANKINKEFKWQSRYYERIVRDEVELYFIREYILNNPKSWCQKTREEYSPNKCNFYN